MLFLMIKVTITKNYAVIQYNRIIIRKDLKSRRKFAFLQNAVIIWNSTPKLYSKR